MDFAALMSKELAKGKASASTEPSSTSKYVRRADAERARKEAYEAEQARLEAEREAKASAKRKRDDEAAQEAEEEAARRKRLGLPPLVKASEEDALELEEGAEDVPEAELRGKLRDLGAPAGPVPTTLELVEEKDMKVQGGAPKDKEARKWVFRQLASYFTMVLTEYQRAMEAERSDTTASKAAYATMVQSRENMKPLFRRFEKGDVDDDLLAPIIEIVQAAQERRYVDANDGYLRLSIGKAAWPIGVTMVGIHERSAREKLHNGERGHVMGDEVTRKFLQSIKRCLTFAQVRWPPEDIRQLMG
ncbi:hypothetical protein VdG2_07846 [Verticillium dahliae VDG2]|nr:hypothetical protein VdG2_07846 [Verticillium dahliae VDG2]